MKILVCGSSGCVGSAVVRALRWRGHHVVETTRTSCDASSDAFALDLAAAPAEAELAARLSALDVDAIVNCAGTALPAAASPRADGLHGAGPIALFRAAERASIGRVVTLSALGTDRDDLDAIERGAWRTRRGADDTLLGLGLDAAVVRSALVYGPGSRSAAMLAALAGAPILALAGGGRRRLQPIHVFELAEAIAALVERTGSARGVYEIGGASVVTFRELLMALRTAAGGDRDPVLFALPRPIARAAAALSDRLARGALDGDVLRLLARVGITDRNAAPVLLGRAPSTLAEGLAVTPPARRSSATRAMAVPSRSRSRELSPQQGRS